jgi:hypothetical protein
MRETVAFIKERKIDGRYKKFFGIAQ